MTEALLPEFELPLEEYLQARMDRAWHHHILRYYIADDGVQTMLEALWMKQYYDEHLRRLDERGGLPQTEAQ